VTSLETSAEGQSRRRHSTTMSVSADLLRQRIFRRAQIVCDQPLRKADRDDRYSVLYYFLPYLAALSSSLSGLLPSLASSAATSSANPYNTHYVVHFSLTCFRNFSTKCSLRSCWLTNRIGVAVVSFHYKAKMGDLTMDQNLIPWGDYQDIEPANEIFVADDDKDMRDVIATTLAPEGFPVTTFEDGDSLLRAARTRIPICVFLDVVMPQRSGLEVLKELRAERYWTPTFLTSARDDPPTVVEAMKSGAYDYITKPFDPNALVQRVRHAVELWSRHERERRALDFQPNGHSEWLRVTPSERDMVLLLRLPAGATLSRASG